MVIEQINRHFGWNIVPQAVDACTPTRGASSVTLSRTTHSYNPLTDTHALKSAPHTFEALRNHYLLRHEVENG